MRVAPLKGSFIVIYCNTLLSLLIKALTHSMPFGRQLLISGASALSVAWLRSGFRVGAAPALVSAREIRRWVSQFRWTRT